MLEPEERGIHLHGLYVTTNQTCYLFPVVGRMVGRMVGRTIGGMVGGMI